ncbi:MAG: response regulator [Turneriella sp.]|nr:response regulator [Turneriella sp.]
MRILIADDSMMVRRILEKFATQLNLEVVGAAANGREALKMFQDLKPDIVSLDITMPEMDGLTAMQKILEVGPEAKIVIVSAVNSKDTIVQAMNAGAKAYIVKPFDEGKIVQTFTDIINSK